MVAGITERGIEEVRQAEWIFLFEVDRYFLIQLV